MLYSIGTKVKFLHTGDRGVIVELLPRGMVMVHLDKEQMEIPASIEDLVLAEDFLNAQKMKTSKGLNPDIKGKIIETKPGKINSSKKRMAPKSVVKKKDKAVLLAFEPKTNSAGEITRYQAWLINNTGREVIYSLRFSLKDGKEKSQNGKINPGSSDPINVLQKDQLNDAPLYSLDCRVITTTGTGPRHHKSIRIKAQQFFKKHGLIPVLRTEGHFYEVFGDLGITTQLAKPESLIEYTKKHRKGRPPETKLENNLFKIFDVEELASFKTEIDLHIENLTPNPSKLSNSEILALQMRRFKDFMADAIRLDVDEVMIVHGKGSGKLRNLIWQALDDYPEVENKEGGYHAGYEFGATRVFF